MLNTAAAEAEADRAAEEAVSAEADRSAVDSAAVEASARGVTPAEAADSRATLGREAMAEVITVATVEDITAATVAAMAAMVTADTVTGPITVLPGEGSDGAFELA